MKNRKFVKTFESYSTIETEKHEKVNEMLGDIWTPFEEPLIALGVATGVIPFLYGYFGGNPKKLKGKTKEELTKIADDAKKELGDTVEQLKRINERKRYK